MGGWNSGRHGGRATIEGCGSLVLDINKLVRLSLPQPDGRAVVAACMSGELRGHPLRIELKAVLFPSDKTGWCRISHPSIRHFSSETGPQDYTVGLRATPCRFGGVRWWFLCPNSSREVAKLYLPNGAHRFASRRAYGLAYVSQRRSRIDVGHDRLRRVYRKLGGKYEHFEQPPPPKPKWMRWKTYERLLAEIAAAENAHDAVFATGVTRFLARWERTLG